ncbi:response regulator [Mucilaginibacter corticis]|uniref:histidine kinase n=1 Tax=Mucilaginibacter corticis TaxID=2597670 RepID=A0A556M7R1_9SPHI|nr:hybrid sensor histidine kinase/response regulator transcription factor [Mucilaginibacter corticis]TSJ35929.1 response regulator [Mucilaginibacter corticis]
MKPVYLFFLFLFCVLAGDAQPYYFRHYQVEQGLSHNTVYCCLQDKQGFLWFGTKDGLNRFDGYNFKVYRHNINDKNSISDNMVRCLRLDHNGRMWVGTNQGLDLFNATNETFIHVNSSRSHIVWTMQFDQHDNCWFIAGTSLFRYNLKTGKLTNFTPMQHFEATFIAQNDDGYIWVSATSGNMERLDTLHNTFKSYNVFNHSPSVASNYIETIYQAGHNKIFVGTTSQGFKEFDCATGTYKDLLTINAEHTGIYVRDFVRYAGDEYWLATESGIYIYHAKNGTFSNLKKRYNDPYSVSDNAIYALYKDGQGGIWAGTYFGGINYYTGQYAAFNKYYPGSGKSSLMGNVVREICKDGYGNLWIGTEDNGLNKLSPDKHTWVHYYPGIKNGITNINIHGLVANGNELLIGTFERGLDIFNIKTGKVERVYVAAKEKNALKSNFVITFCKTRSGTIYVGTTWGLYRYNPQSKDFTLIDKLPFNDYIYSLAEDHRGKIWVGTTFDGIYCYDPVKNTADKLNYRYKVKNALGTSSINGIFEDSAHMLWFSTEGLGLWRYDPDRKTYRFFDLGNGFPSNYVFKVLEDNHRHLWITTTKGLVSLDMGTQNIKVYTQANGLLSDQFNYNSAYKDTDGTMYFGCLKGMISFNPDLFSETHFVSPVYITGFQVQNRELAVSGSDSLLRKSIIHTKQIDLNYKQTSFSIDFAALNYSSPEMSQYQYMMSGLDKGWTTLKSNRRVYFTQLQPGHYRFMVKASNSNGTWSGQEASLAIIIAPPFWERPWAYLCYALLLILILYYLFDQYHRRNRAANERLIEMLEIDKEKQIYHAKIEFFTNVAHEIRTPLTLIKGPMEKMIRKVESVPEIHHNLKIMERNTNRLLDLANQLLDFRKAETNGLSLNFVRTDIVASLNDIVSGFEPIAEQKNQDFTFLHNDQHFYAYIDVEAFNKIISNLVINAIKYGRSVIEVELLKREPGDPTFAVEIRNNGELVPDEMRERLFEPFFRMKESEKQVGTGIGLSLSRSLAELHRGQLVLKKPVNQLNTFNVTLPVHQEKEFDLDGSKTEYEIAGTVKDDKFDFMKPHLLLVDDNPEILDFIADELNEKYAVIKATGAQEALDMIEMEHIQLVISDVMMPGMDGFEFCKRMKTNFDYSHIPIILLTAKNTIQSKIEGLEVGADAYIEKPFSPEHLQVQIANLLVNRSRIMDHFASSPLAHIKTMAYSKPDESFLDKLNAIINQHMENEALDVEQIAGLMNMSKPTLYRKVKAISNLTINELINITRLKAAARLLERGDLKIFEVANMIGYSSQSQLGRNFLKQFGLTPSEYQQSKRV